LSAPGRLARAGPRGLPPLPRGEGRFRSGSQAKPPRRVATGDGDRAPGRPQPGSTTATCTAAGSTGPPGRGARRPAGCRQVEL